MPPHCSRDLGHGPGAESGLLPRLPQPTCSRPVSGVSLGLSLCGFFYRGLPAPALHGFSLCDLRLSSVNGTFPPEGLAPPTASELSYLSSLPRSPVVRSSAQHEPNSHLRPTQCPNHPRRSVRYACRCIDHACRRTDSYCSRIHRFEDISRQRSPGKFRFSSFLTLRSYRRQPFGCLRTLMVMSGLPNRKNGGGQKILLSGLRAMLLGLPASGRSTMSKRKTR
jgi:hypothetical protein